MENDGKIRVILEFDPESNHLNVHSPDNYHRTLAIMRLAEAQLGFQIANQLDAARAQEEQAVVKMAEEKNEKPDIRIARQMPRNLKPN